MSIPSFLNMYNELISSPSISSSNPELDQSNKLVIEKLADWLEELGFTITLEEVPFSRNKLNLLASYGTGTGGLLLSGHTDTVPFDEEQWTKDPFKLTQQDNRLYGLGTIDMKGFFAFVLEAIRDIDLTKLKKPLHILATADEETTMAGAIYFAKTATLKPDCAIIGEPTGLIPIRAHKGHVANVIKVIGKSGHSSDPEKGINALEIMHQVIARLLKLRNKLKTKYHNDSFQIPYPTLNLGHIHGGDAANRICGHCELVMDMRPLPDMHLEDLYELLHKELKPIMQQWPDRIAIEYENMPIPGYECLAQSPALKQVESLAKHQAETANYSTEAPYINQIAPAIILGPGSIDQAHQADEFLDMDFIKPTDLLLKKLITSFCL